MEPLVSCLCVTEGRSEFMPWLLWSFDRQSYAHRELVVIDSSAIPWRHERSDVRIVTAPPGTNVPAKRNRALALARGSLVAWFDDDDWQNPERLERLVPALVAGAPLAGVSSSWFLDVFSGGARRYAGAERVLFNGAGFHTTTARSVRFDERIVRGSDSLWLRVLRARKYRSTLLDPATLSIWLCHEGNLSNPRRRYQFSHSLEDIRAAVGSHAWADTDDQLDALRQRLGGGQPASLLGDPSPRVTRLETPIVPTRSVLRSNPRWTV